MMLDYALEYELVDRNYSRTFNLTEETVKEIQSVKKEIGENLSFGEICENAAKENNMRHAILR